MELAYTQTGAGKPIVILHGLFGQKRNWGSIAKKLSATARVLSLDLRNHGDSDWADGMAYTEMAGDVAETLQRLNVKDVTLVGHSMGGKAAMTLALNRPDLVKRLVVVDIAPAPSPGDFDGYVAALKALALDGLSSRMDADRALTPSVPDPGIRAFLLQNLENRDGAFRWRANLEALAQGMPEILGFPTFPHGHSYKGPTLFIGGAASDYITSAHHGEIKRLFPAAEIDAIAGAGHWVHAENPAAFLTRLETFLEGP